MINKALRIVFVTNNYFPYSGGVVSSIVATMEELLKAGHEVFIITLDFEPETTGIEPRVIRIKCPIRFTYSSNPIAVPWCPHQQMFTIINRLKPDIIHSHHPFLLGSYAVDIAKELHIPIVFTYHTVYETLAHNVPLPQGITQFAIKKLVKTYCEHVNGIIAPSIPIKEHLSTQEITTPIEVIPSGIQPVFIRSEFQFKKKSKKFRLLIVSRFSKEKNIQFLLEMYSLLPAHAFELTLIGYGPYFEQLQDYAYYDLRCSPASVAFIYKPEKVIIATAYHQADLFLFASTADVQPLVLIEAMAGGTPIIALKGPGRGVIEQGKNGFIVENAQEMAQIIERISLDAVLHKRLQLQAWQTAQQYTPTITTHRLVKWYQWVKEGFLTID